MKTLEEILIDLSHSQLKKHGAMERIITVLKITFRDAPEVKYLNIEMTGYEALSLIYDIKDSDLKSSLLSKMFSVRNEDVHSSAKWTFVGFSFIVIIILTILMFNSIYFSKPLEDGEHSIFELILKTFLEAVKLFVTDVN